MSKEDQLSDHLQMIQGVINRLASNSFSYKGWAVTGTLAVLAASSESKISPWLALLPALTFWVLDAYSLMLERAYRSLYRDAVSGAADLFDMSIKGWQGVDNLAKAACSASLLPMYVILFASTFIMGNLR